MFSVLPVQCTVSVLILFSCYWLASPDEIITNVSNDGNDTSGQNKSYLGSNISHLENTCLHNFNWSVNSSSEALQLLETFGVFYSLKSAMKIFKTKYCRTNYHVTTLLENFHIHCPNITEKMEDVPIEKRAPFIAVECVQLKTRRIVTQKLAQKLRGMMLYNPPNFMHIAGKKFNRTHIMRRSFFTIGNYATGYMARTIPVRLPVVTAGYWVDQSVYRVAKTFRNNLPPENSAIYGWPENLFRPDIHFFVNHKPALPGIGPVTDNKYLMTQIYRKWRGAKLIEINSTTIYLDIVSIMINNINRLLNTTYLRPRNITALF